MPSKIQLDENLVFLYICLQKSDMKTIDFAAVGQTTNLKSPAARMRYTRLKRQIEKGVIGANANIHLGSGSGERGGNGEEKERRREKREKKMREKKEKGEKKEKEDVKEWDRGMIGMGMGMALKTDGGVENKEGKRKREIEDTTESDADAISEPDFQLQGWKASILNNTTSPFPSSIRLSTYPQPNHLPHAPIPVYSAPSTPPYNNSQPDISQPISQTLLNQHPSHSFTPQIKLEPYSPFSSFSSYSTERSLSSFHERTAATQNNNENENDADSEDEMPLAKRRGKDTLHNFPNENKNENENPNRKREAWPHANASRIADAYTDANSHSHSHSHPHSYSKMPDPYQNGNGITNEYTRTHTHPPPRPYIANPEFESHISTYPYPNPNPNPYTTPHKRIYTPPGFRHENFSTSNLTLLAPSSSPSSTPSPSPQESPSPSPYPPPCTPSSAPLYPHSHSQHPTWTETYQSYRHLWGTERMARLSPPSLSTPPPPTTPPRHHTPNPTPHSNFPPLSQSQSQSQSKSQSAHPNTHLSSPQW